MKKDTGLVHIYYGGGKGKTTAGMGLCLRAAGYGYKVLIYQFMKSNQSSERAILEKISNITMVSGLEEEKFSIQMTTGEKELRKNYYAEQFAKITKRAIAENYDVVYLDEIIYTIQAGLLEEDILRNFLEHKPAKLEVILTGNTPSETIISLADYVTEIRKVKHPYDTGQPARLGIEK